MKKKLLGLMCAVALVSACGSGGGGGGATLQSEVNTATAAMADLFDYLIAECLEVLSSPPPQACACPDGGTITTAMVDEQQVATFDNCTSNGNVFSGTTMTTGDGNVTFDMTQFDGCSAVTGTISGLPDTCSGTINITCPAGSDSCTMSADCETCTL